MEVKALQQILSQFRQMQESLQKQVETVQVEASAGGGMVNVKMNGQKQVTEAAHRSRSVCRKRSGIAAGPDSRGRERSRPPRG